MDPDAALAEIRTQAAQLLSGTLTPDRFTVVAESLAEQVQGLDEWLGKGGFLPPAWNRQTLIWTLEGATLTNLKYDCTARRLRVSVDWGTFKWDADNTGWTAGIDPDRRVQ